MKIDRKFGINVTELGNLPMRERFDLFRDIGFQTIEAATAPEYADREFDDYVRLIRDYGFHVASGHDWYHFFTPNDPQGVRQVYDRFYRNLDRTKAMGSDRLVWYSGDNDRFSGEEAIDALLERLAPVLERAASLGISLLLETEYSPLGLDPSTSIVTMEKIMKRSESPWLGVNFDPANIYVAGEEAFPMAYAHLKPWIKHFHLKDARLFDERLAYDRECSPEKGTGRMGICTPLGRGAVNMHGLLETVAKDNYDGYFIFELHVPNHLKVQTLRESLAFAHRYL
jgi:sugar phosphate isomerase/epimerase